MSIYLKPSYAGEVDRLEIIGRAYDIVLVAVGYEQRSSHLGQILKGKAQKRIAIPFETDRILSYTANEDILRKKGFEIAELQEREIIEWWRLYLVETTESQAAILRVCIDISSLTRSRLARLIEGLVTTDVRRTVEVDFVYTVAEFSPPPVVSEVAATCGAVSSFLAGWPSDPERPVAAIIGLGYELQKAVGAIEYLEPATRILVCPISKDLRFDHQVQVANRDLLREAGGSEVFSYPIDRPTQCLELLDALIHGMKDEKRVIAIPFGPKIFALCCMLMACRYYPEVGVWRISAESGHEPKDQVASATTIGLRVRFEGLPSTVS